MIVGLADALSLSRIALLLPFVSAIVDRRPGLAIGIFILVVVSDVLDGLWARKHHTATPRGALIDHGSDAVFVTGATAVWAWLGLLPTALAVAIAVAFAQYALDSRPLAGPRASALGRINGIAYFVLTGIALMVYFYSPNQPWLSLVRIFAYALLLSTLASIATRAYYTFHHRGVD